MTRALACGEHLTRRARSTDGVPGRSWSIPPGQMQTGFAHGAAGIRHALLSLYGAAPRPAELEAAKDSAAFEAALYFAPRRGWLPFPGFDPQGPMMTAWCWGGPGIALSYSAHPEAIREESLFSENFELALSACLGKGATREDFLCCGNLGRVLILDHAARRLPDRVGLAEKARSIAFDVLRRMKGRGDFGWPQEGPDHYPLNPSFLKGAAGVAYAWLALDRRLPMVLGLEPPFSPDRA